MKIKHVHQYKLPNNRKIKGINFVCNRFTTGLENLIIRYEEIKNCINKNSSNNVIISLTSFPQRNEELFYTLKSLLNQESEVNGIVIWLAEEQYPQKKIPQKLKDLETYGVEFRFCDDLKSHKKYFYALQEYKDYCIITTDDDVIYPEEIGRAHV